MSKRYQFYIVEREKGKTYQEIADQFGVSRQCVQQACTRKYGKRKAYKNLKCVFPVLKQWMIVHDYSGMTLFREAQTCGMVLCYQAFQNRMKGKTKITLLDEDILSNITGIPASELFTM